MMDQINQLMSSILVIRDLNTIFVLFCDSGENGNKLLGKNKNLVSKILLYTLLHIRIV